MTDTAILVIELILLFISVSFLVEILQRRLGPDQLRRFIGGRPPVAALKGIVIGFVTPFCTYSAVPLLVGLRRAGVPPAGYIAFIAAAPVLDPILFGALWLITGPTVAITYATVTFAAAMTLALVAQHVGVEQIAKFFSPEQFGQQVFVECERSGAPFGKRGITLVHVCGDPADQQRLCEW